MGCPVGCVIWDESGGNTSGFSIQPDPPRSSTFFCSIFCIRASKFRFAELKVCYYSLLILSRKLSLCCCNQLQQTGTLGSNQQSESPSEVIYATKLVYERLVVMTQSPERQPEEEPATLTAEEVTADNQDNTQAAHKGPRKRTKTGCLTCRKRRIKCGEEKYDYKLSSRSY